MAEQEKEMNRDFDFSINLSGQTLYTCMRNAGYAPERASHTTSNTKSKFHRLLGGRPYPKFHLYCALSADAKSATLNLHLDQKKPSYKGTHAHAAEHDGAIVKAEVRRIQSFL